MAKKSKTPDLPGIQGEGVELLVIADVAKAVNIYERKKEKRCEASPGEIAAKRDLKEQLAKYRDKLPKNSDGQLFYRHEGVDYILDEVLKRRLVDDGDGPSED